tara:strand:+ start:697 stop:948 length:252 start_codon:yes stop_codon:yes gene_type:complete
MKFFAQINILPQDAILDPQGKTVENNTTKLGLENISNIRIGKHITLHIEAPSKEIAQEKIDQLCQKLLVNQITEKYEYKISEV